MKTSWTCAGCGETEQSLSECEGCGARRRRVRPEAASLFNVAVPTGHVEPAKPVALTVPQEKNANLYRGLLVTGNLVVAACTIVVLAVFSFFVGIVATAFM